MSATVPPPTALVQALPRLLTRQWRQVQKQSDAMPRQLVVCDSDFGNGAGLFRAWQTWRTLTSSATPHPTSHATLPTATLHYVALLHQALGTAALADKDVPPALRAQLVAAWPVLTPGLHRLVLDDGAVVLTLAVRAPQQTPTHVLQQLVAGAELLLLHGAAWAHTPTRQHSALCHSLAKLARPHALLALPWTAISADATTATQHLTPLLRQAGFQWVAASEATALDHPANTLLTATFAPRWRTPRHAAPRAGAWAQRSAVVVGAGLAGCAIAYSLAQRGWRVTVLERHAAPARETSSHRAALLHPHLAKDDSPLARASRAGYWLALQHWHKLQAATPAALLYQRCGILEVPEAAASDWPPQLAALGLPPDYVQAVDAESAAALSGLRREDVPQGGLWWTHGAWADPPALCRAGLAQPNISAQYGVAVARLAHHGKAWQALDAHGTLLAQAEVVVVANALGARPLLHASGLLEAAHSLPLQAVRGQINYLAAPLPVSTWPRSALCGDGYVLPPHKGIAQYGASFSEGDSDTAWRSQEAAANRARLHRLLPRLTWHGAAAELGETDASEHGWVGVRCVAPDRLPLLGAWQAAPAGLYLATAYAARGLTWSALGGELIASLLEGEPLPLERDLCASLAPLRFGVGET